MLKRTRKPVSDKQIMQMIHLINRMKRIFALFGILTFLWTSGPYQYIQARTNIFESSHPYVINENYNSDVENTNGINYEELGIVEEVVSKRTETSKTFRRVDGSYVVALYNGRIHYEDDGELKDIDNRFLLDESTNLYENSNNSFKVKFPKTLDDNKKIKLSMDHYDIAWNILNINASRVLNEGSTVTPNNIKELTHVNQSLSYIEVQPGVDIQYIVTGSRVKENIILNEYVPDFSLTFEYKIKDLSITEDEDGHLIFINDSNETIFMFEDLYMVDANMNESFEVDITYNKSGSDEYMVAITPSDEWLLGATYPVIVDPTIVNPDQSISIYDTYVSEGSSTSNYGRSTFLPISNTYSYSEQQALISFHIPTFIMDKQITYSTLELTRSSGSTQRTIYLHENLTNFIDYGTGGVTWNTKPDYANDIVDYHIISSSASYKFNITESVQRWQIEGITNVPGFTLKDKYDYGTYYSVKSIEYTTISMKPTIEIGYVDPSGIKDYWTYSTQDIGDAGVGYVSDYTGLLTLVRSDISFITEKQSLNLSMIYSVGFKDVNIGYGDGWRTNYDMFVEYDTDADRYSTIDASGSKEFYQIKSVCEDKFKVDPSMIYQCYDAEDGSSNVLVLETDGSLNYANYLVVTPDEIYYRFDSSGYLYEIKDYSTQNELSITIHRESTAPYKIDYILDDTGNMLNFTYYNGDLDYVELNLKQPGGGYGVDIERVDYTIHPSTKQQLSVAYKKDYNGDNVYSTDTTATYTYTTSNVLISAENSSSEKVTYNIDSSSLKVNTITSTFNSENIALITYDYDLKKTTIVDQYNRYVIYKFDDFGHTINIIDSFGSSRSYKFINLYTDWDNGSIYVNEDGSPNYRYNHRMIGSSVPVQENGNLILNGGFEFDLSSQYDGWNLIQTSGSGSSYLRVSSSCMIDDRCASLTNPISSESRLTQTIILDAGIYTFSAYVKNSTGSEDVYLDVVGESYGGITTPVDNDSTWTLNRVLFVIEEDDTSVTLSLINEGNGASYFDGVQLYKGFGDTIPNLIENPSFEYAEGSWIPGWEPLSSNIARVTNTYDDAVLSSILGAYGIRITGDGTVSRSYEIDSQNATNGQVIEVGSPIVTVSGWSKSDGTPISKSDSDPYDRFYRIKVAMYDVNDTQLGTYLYVDFDPSIEGWQYNNASFEVVTGTSYLRVWVEYQGEGNVYFDNIAVHNGSLYTKYYFDENISGAPETTVIEPSGIETVYTYDSKDTYSDVPMFISSDGEVTAISKDMYNKINSITSNNLSMNMSANGDGVTIGLSIVNGSTEYFSMSSTMSSTGFNQYSSSFTDEFGNTTSYYNDTLNGMLEAIEEANQVQTHYIYDDYGNLERVEVTDDYTNSSSEIYGYTVYGYDPQGRINKIWLDYDENQNVYYEIIYDAIGNIDKVLIGTTVLMDYDYTPISGYKTDLVSLQKYGNLDEMSFSYDDKHRLETISFKESSESIPNMLYRFEYDNEDRLAVKVIYDPTNSSIIDNREYYSYDISGRISRIFDEMGNDYEYAYTDKGQLENISIRVDGSLEQSNAFTYGDKGRLELIEYININDVAVSKDYIYSSADALERLQDVQLKYNSTIISTQGVLYVGYTDRVQSITYDIGTQSGDEIKYEYTYDSLGNISTVKYYKTNLVSPKTLHTYVYDELNQLIIVHSRDYSVSTSTFTSTNNTKYYYYDQRGNIDATKTFLYGQEDITTPVQPSFYLRNTGTYSAIMYYNGTQDYQDIYNLNVGQTPNLSFVYYDSMWQDFPISLTTTMTFNNLDTSTPGYYYRQYRATNGSSYILDFRIVFKVGNPVPTATTPQESMTYAYDDTWIDLLESYDIIRGGTTYTTEIVYEGNDTQGTPSIIREYENATLSRVIELSWSGRDLTSYKVYSDLAMQNHISTLLFTYNDEGIRTSKTFIDVMNSANSYSIDYTLLDGRVIYETDGEYGIYYTYDETGTLVSFNYDSNVATSSDGAEYFYLRNLQGDITAIVDSTGAIVVEYTYNAYGNILDTDVVSGYEDIAEHNSYTYRGYRRDQETGWYYLQSRYYVSETGRFLNSDVVLGIEGNALSNNLFSYTQNNPINFIDPSGYLYISYDQILNIMKAVLIGLVMNPIGYLLVYYGMTKLYVLIAAKAAWIGVKLGAFAGPLKWVLGGLFGAIALNYGWDLLDALIQKKGLNITWKKSRWGFYYGIDVSVE
ncbi:MAG: DNRLRE domain-containing protein [Acholeplasma sp.]|jgi:RHS repeat-associated protein|nr:MAG: DNRLRE domain-containing protein [Acholeplasma sp.]